MFLSIGVCGDVEKSRASLMPTLSITPGARVQRMARCAAPLFGVSPVEISCVATAQSRSAAGLDVSRNAC